MVTTTIMLGSAATFFCLGGVFCLYIHTISKSIRRNQVHDLRCGQKIDGEVCCEQDRDSREVSCSRQGICGNRTKKTRRKDRKNDMHEEGEEVEQRSTSSFVDNDEKQLEKLEQQRTRSDFSDENKEILKEIEQQKRRSDSSIQNKQLMIHEKRTSNSGNDSKELLKTDDTTWEDSSMDNGGRRENRRVWESRDTFSETENIAQHQELQEENLETQITPKQQQSISRNEEKIRKREEKEAKKKQEKERRKREKEEKKQMQLEKRRESREEKMRKKEEQKELRRNQQILNKEKRDRKGEIEKLNEDDLEEEKGSMDYEQTNMNYQEIRNILVGKQSSTMKDKNDY